MILLIDVGNTNIVLGIHDNEKYTLKQITKRRRKR